MAYGFILGQKPSIPASDFPIGGIIIWSGSQSDIPTNWQLCDGTNGTPDLRGQFVIGAGGNYNVGNSGGESEHTLTVNEMPSHNHTLLKIGSGTGTSAEKVLTGTGNAPSTSSSLIYDTGSSQPHNNMPPYYALCYIMKIA